MSFSACMKKLNLLKVKFYLTCLLTHFIIKLYYLFETFFKKILDFIGTAKSGTRSPTSMSTSSEDKYLTYF